MRIAPRLFAAALAVAAAAPARAEVVEATASTVVSAGQQLRGALPGVKPELDTLVPIFELVSVRAREVRNPLLQHLEVVVSGWVSGDVKDVRWSSGTTDHVTGDLLVGYVRGQAFNQALTIRAGRAAVVAGTGRMLQLDGADLLVRLPGGLSASAFGGIPVAQRFRTRAGERSWNPAGGDLAYGGRLGWTLARPGEFGRGLDLGLSAMAVTDGGETVRKDAGLDLRLQPRAGLVLTGTGVYALEAGRVAELGLTASYEASRTVSLTADARRVAPDLLLAQNSILAVFADAQRTDLGGGVRWQVAETTSLGLDYHALLEPTGRGSGTELGHEAAARAAWERGPARLGGELTWLATGGLGSEQNGYVGGRLFGRRELGRAFLAGDVVVHALRREINGNKVAATGSLSGGWVLGRGWSAVLAGRAGVTPFLEQQADLLVKLAYNQTYRVREVK